MDDTKWIEKLDAMLSLESYLTNTVMFCVVIESTELMNQKSVEELAKKYDLTPCGMYQNNRKYALIFQDDGFENIKKVEDSLIGELTLKYPLYWKRMISPENVDPEEVYDRARFPMSVTDNLEKKTRLLDSLKRAGWIYFENSDVELRETAETRKL